MAEPTGHAPAEPIAYNTAAIHKYGDEPQEAGQGFELRKTKEQGIPDDLEDLRYGLYARAGYRWVGLHFTYRLSNIFSDQFSPCNDRSALPPCMPVAQLGLTVML